MSEDKKFKRLFFDIETSYNVVSTWNIGYDVHIGHENILKERAIICICYKWEHEKTVHSLKWRNGDDKQLLIDFMKILDSADEIIGHNSDKFDLPWIRTRCIYHRISMFPDYQSIDTLKISYSKFRFNSNKLDYLGKFLGFGGKEDTGGFKLWQDIIERNSTTAMDKMIRYCKRDVLLLEKVFQRLFKYAKHKTHVGVIEGKLKTSCPKCGSYKISQNGQRVLASGNIQHRMRCSSCGGHFTLPNYILDKLKTK